MKKTIFFLITIIYSLTSLYSQEIKLDSILNIIQDKPDTVKVQTLIDYYNKFEQGRILNGRFFLDEALKLAENIDNDKWQGNVLLNYGKFYILTGEYEQAIELITQSKIIFENTDNCPGIGSAYNNLGATYEKMGRYDEAMDCLIKALSMYELNADSLNIAKIYLNLGLLYSRQDDYEKSLELYNKSLRIRESRGDKAGMALLYNNIAIVNYYLEDYDNVRSNFEKAYKIYVELGYERQQLMALSNLAEILNIIGQKGKSLDIYFKILELEKNLGQKGEFVQTYLLIGDLYKSKGDFFNAKKYMYISLDIAQSIGALADISDAYNLLSQLYKAEHKYKEALKYHELYFSFNDSLFNTEKSRQIKEIETKYETKKKEQIISNLENQQIIKNLQIKKQRIFLFSLIAGFLSISIFLIILFKQVKKIRTANELLAYQKKQITDSIEYASRIQTAILPPGDYIRRFIPEHFILYKPRDIVSGDFYWITHKDNKIVVAVVDCTGHGVPGAFMSMLGFAFLNEIVNKETELKASSILNQLRNYVKSSLHQTGKECETKDGMDIALCIIDPDNLTMQYSGAYNPLYLIRNQEFISLKADRMPIGIHINEKESFTNHIIEIQKDDIVYIFTDGYIDQFGGPNTQKFKISNFRNLLVSIKEKPMDKQKQILEQKFADWRGTYEQIDDVLVMGIKIK